MVRTHSNPNCSHFNCAIKFQCLKKKYAITDKKKAFHWRSRAIIIHRTNICYLLDIFSLIARLFIQPRDRQTIAPPGWILNSDSDTPLLSGDITFALAQIGNIPRDK